MQINIATIRQLESDAARFDSRLEFARHVGPIIETAYEGVVLTTGGGLLRTREAQDIDRSLTQIYREAGYDAEDDYDLACAIWANLRGEA